MAVNIRSFRLVKAVSLIAVLLWCYSSRTEVHSASSDAGRVLPLKHLAGSASAGSDDSGREMRIGIGDDYFDGTSSPQRVERHLQLARRLNVKYLRCAFSWNAIEKTRGEYDWKFWDMLVHAAEHNGIELLPYVAYTPQWAARDAKDFWKQPPREPRVFGDFMFRIAERYRGRIRSWEIWNEPDNQDFWTGTAQEFASLVKIVARHIREADPAAVLVLGGMAHGPSAFFHELIDAQVAGYVDVIAMHAYPESWLQERAETVFQEWIPAMCKLIQMTNSGDALWVNEMGYPDYRLSPAKASIYGTKVFYHYEHTREYQASMLFKFEVMALASQQIGLTGWYRIDDFPISERRLGSDRVNYHLGLVDAHGSPKPSFFALRFFVQLFGSQSKLIHTRAVTPPHSQAVLYVFTRPDHRIIVVGWLRSSHVDEVRVQTGELRDSRVEHVSVAAPCVRPALLGYFDTEGHRRSGRPVARPIQDIQLTGRSVFVEELACPASSQ